MKPSLIILLMLISASSCSPTHRLSRLLALHPELNTPDTIFINDTMTIPQVEADTIINLNRMPDTIILQKDRLEISISRVHDTLYIRGKCKADTVFIHKTIPVEKIKIVKQDRLDQMIRMIPWLMGLIVVISLLRLLFIYRFK